jgi:hypothetical protein
VKGRTNPRRHRLQSPNPNPSTPNSSPGDGHGRGAAASGADRAVLLSGGGSFVRAAARRSGARGHLPPGPLRLLRAPRPPGPLHGTHPALRWLALLHRDPIAGLGLGFHYPFVLASIRWCAARSDACLFVRLFPGTASWHSVLVFTGLAPALRLWHLEGL